MKLIFTLKYIGKITLIMFAVLAMGSMTGQGMWFNVSVLLSFVAYCIGSIEYQFRKRERKVLIKEKVKCN